MKHPLQRHARPILLYSRAALSCPTFFCVIDYLVGTHTELIKPVNNVLDKDVYRFSILHDAIFNKIIL